jgi:hypothetical protein
VSRIVIRNAAAQAAIEGRVGSSMKGTSEWRGTGGRTESLRPAAADYVDVPVVLDPLDAPC